MLIFFLQMVDLRHCCFWNHGAVVLQISYSDDWLFNQSLWTTLCTFFLLMEITALKNCTSNQCVISLLVAGSSFNKPLVKCSVATLKRTGAPFIQDGPCSEVTPKLSKCRECKPNQRGKKIPNIFCRFYAFRRYSNDYCFNIFFSHVHTHTRTHACTYFLFRLSIFPCKTSMM